MGSPSSERAGPGPLLANLLVGVLCLIWGSTWVVIKEGLEDLPPLLSVAVRFAVATAGMAFVAAWISKREGGLRPPPWLAIVMGVSQFSVSYGIVYWSETILPSSLVCVLWSTYPLMIAVAGHFFLDGERLDRSQMLGFLAGFVGVGVLYLNDVRTVGEEGLMAAGVLLLSPLTVAVGTVVIKRHGAEYSSTLLNRNGMLVGASLLALATWLLERDAPVSWTPKAVASVAYLAIVGSVVAFGIYFWLLRYDKATRLSVVTYVTPAVALALGAVFQGERIDGVTIIGTGLILSGVWLAGRRGSR